jgi:hypothetical protein
LKQGFARVRCRDCGGTMRIIAFIEDQRVVRDIFVPLLLWDEPRPPPVTPGAFGFSVSLGLFRKNCGRSILDFGSWQRDNPSNGRSCATTRWAATDSLLGDREGDSCGPQMRSDMTLALVREMA